MKLTLESTDVVTTFRRGAEQVPVREWRGETEDGTPVLAYIAAVSAQTHDHERLKAFDQQLVELRKATSPQVIDLRFVL